MEFKELLEFLNGEKPTYEQLLGTDEWIEKRDQVLKRDRFYCSKCGKSKTFLLQNKIYNFDKSQIIELELGEKSIIVDKVIVDDKIRHLQIHHEFYIIKTLPWNYDDFALTTLCNWCHWEFHKNEKVPIYSKEDNMLLNFESCKRCNGAGVFPEYKHVDKGICFRCKGSKYEELIKSPHKLWIEE